MFGCKTQIDDGDDVNVSVENYRIDIIIPCSIGKSPEDQLPADIVHLCSPIKIIDNSDKKIYLPNRDSRLIGVGWTTNREMSIFVDKPCTATQITSDNCTESAINNSVSSKFRRMQIDGFSQNIQLLDSLILENILLNINKDVDNNTRIYILSKNKTVNTVLTFTDTSYEHYYDNVDTLFEQMTADIKNGVLNFKIVYNPPGLLAKVESSEPVKINYGNDKPQKKKDSKDNTPNPNIVLSSLKRSAGNEVQWSKDLANKASKLTLRFTVNGEVYSYDVTNSYSFNFIPGKKEAQTHFTTVELIPEFKDKKMKVSGALVLKDQKFNCE